MKRYPTDGDSGGGVSGCSKFLLGVAAFAIALGVAIGILVN